MLYLLQITVEYRGLSQPELFHIWIEEAEKVLATREEGLIKELWKVFYFIFDRPTTLTALFV